MLRFQPRPKHVWLSALIATLTMAVSVVVLSAFRVVELSPFTLIGENPALTGAIVCLPMIVALLWASDRLRKERKQDHEEGPAGKDDDSTLREALERTRLILDGTLDAVVGMDSQGTITDWNARAEAMFGWTRKEAIGRKLVETIIPPRYRDAHNQGFRRFLSSGEGLFLNRRVEVAALRRDGTELPIELTISPLKMGGSYVFSSFIADITERKRDEQALRESEERYRAVVEDQTEVISRLREDGTFTFVNDVYCRFFGKQAREILGTRWHPVVFPEDRPHVEAQLCGLSLSNPVVVIENRVYAGTGQVRWMQFVNRGYFDSEGRLVEIQSVGRDITERRQAEEALRANEQMLRNLITERERLMQDLHDGIIQSLYAVGMSVDECRRLTVEDPRKAGMKLGQTVDDINRVIREVRHHLVQGDDDLPFSAHRLKTELTRIAGSMERAKALHFRLKIDPRAAECLTTEERKEILYIAQETMSNCLRHSGASVANVSLRLGRDRVYLEVEDDGRGFDTTTLLETSGGLRNIERRAEKVGARVEIVSRREHGTRIRMSVPIHN